MVYLRQLAPQRRRRLASLMDKSNEGRLTRAERVELKRFGAEVQRLMLANSELLARVARPELFDAQGQPIRHRFRQALRDAPALHGARREKTARA